MEKPPCPMGNLPPSFRPERRRRAVEKPPSPMGTRFLHYAVLRTAPVEMTRGVTAVLRTATPRIKSGVRRNDERG